MSKTKASAPTGWQGGGGFKFLRLGSVIADPEGLFVLDITWENLASVLWSRIINAQPVKSEFSNPALGTFQNVFYVLCFEGFDSKSRNELTYEIVVRSIASDLAVGSDRCVVFADNSQLDKALLEKLGIEICAVPRRIDWVHPFNVPA